MLRRSERVEFRCFEYGDQDVAREGPQGFDDSLGDTQPIRRSSLKQGAALNTA